MKRQSRQHSIVWAVVLCTLLTAVCLQDVYAQVAKPPALEKSALEQQLFDDLKSQSKGMPPRNKLSPAGAKGEDLGSSPRDRSPLAEIGQQMREVETRLRQRDTSATTQQLQAQILDRLTKLLEAQQSQQKQSSSSTASARASTGSQGSNKGNLGNQSGDETGTSAHSQSATSVDSVIKKSNQIWGVLPERVQQRMQAAANEEFLPQYEQRIQLYYERLAERNKKK